MRLYKIITFITLFLGINSIAQPGIGSAKSLIKIEFEDIFGLEISQQEVNLEINTLEKFAQGTQTNWLNSHLIVTGARSFEIRVKTIEPNFFSNNTETNVPVSKIKISAKTNSNANTLFLSDISQILISENNGSMVNYIDVNYQIPPENTFSFVSNTTNIFETLVIYTLIPN